ncbi:MAG: DUF3892 domain-containing protein [Actinomycetota bacterium]|nr:DUF3892 domain-containing protein [Actinomycetota bacterium]
MARRRIRSTRKDRDCDILSVCNKAEYWPPRAKAEAIRDIDAGEHAYFVAEASHESEVHTYTLNGVNHIKTHADASSANNLDNLPGC